MEEMTSGSFGRLCATLCVLTLIASPFVTMYGSGEFESPVSGTAAAVTEDFTATDSECATAPQTGAPAPKPGLNPVAPTALDASDMGWESMPPQGAYAATYLETVNSIHNIDDAQSMGYTGNGTIIGIVDTGVDFCHPSLEDAYAVVDDPASPYDGWPIAFDAMSMSTYLSSGDADGTWYSNTTINGTGPFEVTRTIDITALNEFSTDEQIGKDITNQASSVEGGNKLDFDLTDLNCTYDSENWYFGYTVFPPRAAPVGVAAHNEVRTLLMIDTDNETSGSTVAPDGYLIDTLSAHSSRVTAVAYSPDGSRLATASVDRTVKVWNVADQSLEVAFTAHTNPVYGLAWSHDGSMIASGETNLIYLFDSETGEILQSIAVADGPANEDDPTKHIDDKTSADYLDFSPNDALLAYCDGSSVVVYDVIAGEKLTYIKASGGGFSGPSFGVDFSPDGTKLAITDNSDYRVVRVFDLATIADEKIAFPYPNGVHSDDDTFDFLADLRFDDMSGAGPAAAVFGDGWYSVEAGKTMKTGTFNMNFPLTIIPANAIILEANLTVVYSVNDADSDGILGSGASQVTVASGSAINMWTPVPTGVTPAPGDTDVKVEIDILALGFDTWEKYKSLWVEYVNDDDGNDTVNFDQVALFLRFVSPIKTPVLSTPQHGQYITSVAYSPDGASILTSSRDGQARVFDAATGAMTVNMTVWPVATREVYPMAWACWADDGSLIATSEYPINTMTLAKAVRIWSADGTLVHTYAQNYPVLCMDWSGASDLALGSWNYSAAIISDVGTGDEWTPMIAHKIDFVLERTLTSIWDAKGEAWVPYLTNATLWSWTGSEWEKSVLSELGGRHASISLGLRFYGQFSVPRSALGDPMTVHCALMTVTKTTRAIGEIISDGTIAATDSLMLDNKEVVPDSEIISVYVTGEGLDEEASDQAGYSHMARLDHPWKLVTDTLQVFVDGTPLTAGNFELKSNGFVYFNMAVPGTVTADYAFVQIQQDTMTDTPVSNNPGDVVFPLANSLVNELHVETLELSLNGVLMMEGVDYVFDEESQTIMLVGAMAGGLKAGETVSATYDFGQYIVDYEDGIVNYHSPVMHGWVVVAEYNHNGTSHAMDSVPADPLVFDYDYDWIEDKYDLDGQGEPDGGVDFQDRWTRASVFASVTRRYYTVDLGASGSVSGTYHFGYHPSDALNLMNNGLGILVVDADEAGIYDGVIIDFNNDKVFDGNDQVFGRDSPLARYDDFNHTASLMGDPGKPYVETPDGYPDVSGGLLYFISDGVTPIPYSNIYTDRAGIENKIPANGEVVCFIGEFDGTTHGTGIASIITGEGRLPDRPITPVAPDAKIIATANSNSDLVASWYFITEGYDGKPGTGDEADIAITASSITSTYNDGWDRYSRMADFASASNSDGTTLFVIPAGEASGEGYGSLTSPGAAASALTVGIVTDYTRESYVNGGTEAEFSGVGDVQGYSGKGPTPVGKPKPDVVAAGSTYVDRPLSGTDGFLDYLYPTWTSVDVSAAVATGIAALAYEAYAEAENAHPGIETGKALLMSGACDLGYDVLTQGAGMLDAEASVNLATGQGGALVEPTFIVPGDFNGLVYDSFASVLYPGDTDEVELTVTNAGPSTATYEASALTLKSLGTVEAEATTYTYTFYTDEINATLPSNPSKKAEYTVFTNGAGFVLNETGLYAPSWTDTIVFFNNTAPLMEFTGTTNRANLLATYPADMKTYLVDPDRKFDRLLDMTLYLQTGTDIELLDPSDYTYNHESYDISLSFIPLNGTKLIGFYNATAKRLDSMMGPEDNYIAYPSGKKVASFDESLWNDADLVKVTAYYDWNDFATPEYRASEMNSSYYLRLSDWNNSGDSYLASWRDTGVSNYSDLRVSFPTHNNVGMKDMELDRRYYDLSTLATSTAVANVVSATVHNPAQRTHDGLSIAFLPFDEAKSSPYTHVSFIVEFFTKSAQPWMTVNGDAVDTISVPAGSSVTVTVGFDIPDDAPVGGYDAQIQLVDASTDKATIVPVFINIATDKAMFQFGGASDASSDMYNSNRVGSGYSRTFGTTDISKTVTGDWRFYMMNMPGEGVFSSTSGLKFMITLNWTNEPSDLDVIVMTAAPGKDSATQNDMPRFGSYTLEINKGSSAEEGGFFTTTNGSKEIIALDLKPGLNIIGVKCVALSGLTPFEPVSGDVFYMRMSTDLYAPTNHYSSSAPISFMSSRDFDGGLNVAAIGPAITQRNESEEIPQDYESWWNFPNWGEWMREGSYTRILNLEKVLILDVHIWGHDDCPDLDLGVFTDVNKDGILQLDEVVDSACKVTGGSLWDYDADADADEHVKWLSPPDGQYIVKVLGFTTTSTISDGSMGGHFDIEISQTLDTGEGYKILGANDDGILSGTEEKLPANTPVEVSLSWKFPGNTNDGAYGGGVLLGTKDAPKIMLIPANVRLDTQAPTFTDFVLTPGETINVGDIDLRSYFADESEEMAARPASVWLDGVDVTPQCTQGTGSIMMPARGLREGGHEFIVTITDKAGNSATMAYNFAVDTMAPMLAIEGEASTLTRDAKAVISGITDGATLEVNRSMVPLGADGSFSVEVGLVEGENVIPVISRDAIGNTISTRRSFFLDTTAPVLLRTRFEGASMYTNSDLEAIFGGFDTTVEYHGLSVSVNGELHPAFADGTFSVPVSLTEGTNTFTVVPVDEAGNEGQPITLTKILDTKAPVLTLDARIVLSDAVSIEYVGTVDDPTATVMVNGFRATVSTDGTFRVRDYVLTFGSSTLVVIATDAAGNVDVGETVVVNQAPVQTLNPVGAEPETVEGKLTPTEGWLLLVVFAIVGIVVGLVVALVAIKGGGGSGDEPAGEGVAEEAQEPTAEEPQN